MQFLCPTGEDLLLHLLNKYNKTITFYSHELAASRHVMHADFLCHIPLHVLRGKMLIVIGKNSIQLYTFA